MTLYLFDDARARDWTPFATTRPVGELLLGCLLLRERAERFWGAECAGALVDRDLAGFAEAGTPPIFHDVPVPSDEPLILFSSRAAPNLVAAPPPLPSTETTAKLMIGDEPVGWIVPPGAAPPSIGDLMSPGTATPEAPIVQIKGNVVGRPWDLIAMNGAQIREDMPAWSTGGHSSIPKGVHCVGAEQISLGHGVHLEPGVVLDASHGPIHLSDNVEVRAFTRLAGPAFVGEGTRLLGGAFEAVSIGPHCKIRGEVGSSVVLGYSNKAHDGYLGHSYLGKWVNLGALTTTSDLKNTYGTVRAPTPEGLVDTGLQKIGSMIGDHAKTGIGTMLSTGSVIGAGSNLFGDVMPPRSVPPFTWGGAGNALEEYDLERFLAVAERTMGRRSVALRDEDRTLLSRAWEKTRPDRS